MLQIILQHLKKIQNFWFIINKSQHDNAKSILQLRVL